MHTDKYDKIIKLSKETPRSNPIPALRTECEPLVLNILEIKGDGNCLFYSLLVGLIRLKIKKFEKMEISSEYSLKYLYDNIFNFRLEIVEWLRNNLNTLANKNDPESPTFEQLILEICEDKVPPIKNIRTYLHNMATDIDSWGDEIIIHAFIYITKINIVIIRRISSYYKIMSGNICYDGIWLYHTYPIHFELIFPINVDENYLIDKESKRIEVRPSIKKDNYNKIINYDGVKNQMLKVQKKTQELETKGFPPRPHQGETAIPDAPINDEEVDIQIAIMESLNPDGKEIQQKYFNQSKYYKKYLKYKLKYNQLKEKLN